MPFGDGTGPAGGGRGLGRGKGRRQGAGRGMMGGPFAAGPSGNCICPNCGHKEPHITGQPCMGKTCAKCGTQMTRE